jgi:hypothetical protein
MELGLRRSPRDGVAAKAGFSNFLRNLAPDFLQYLSKTPNQGRWDNEVATTGLLHYQR